MRGNLLLVPFHFRFFLNPKIKKNSFRQCCILFLFMSLVTYCTLMECVCGCDSVTVGWGPPTGALGLRCGNCPLPPSPASITCGQPELVPTGRTCPLGLSQALQILPLEDQLPLHRCHFSQVPSTQDLERSCHLIAGCSQEALCSQVAFQSILGPSGLVFPHCPAPSLIQTVVWPSILFSTHNSWSSHDEGQGVELTWVLLIRSFIN